MRLKGDEVIRLENVNVMKIKDVEVGWFKKLLSASLHTYPSLACKNL